MKNLYEKIAIIKLKFNEYFHRISASRKNFYASDFLLTLLQMRNEDFQG